MAPFFPRSNCALRQVWPFVFLFFFALFLFSFFTLFLCSFFTLFLPFFYPFFTLFYPLFVHLKTFFFIFCFLKTQTRTSRVKVQPLAYRIIHPCRSRAGIFSGNVCQPKMGRFADLVDVLGLFWGLFAPQKTLSHDRDPPQPALYLLLIDIDPPDLRRWVVASSPCSANCNRTRFPLHRKNQQLTGHAEDDGGSVNGSVYGSVDGSGRWTSGR
jgi:hypothetical protein